MKRLKGIFLGLILSVASLPMPYIAFADDAQPSAAVQAAGVPVQVQAAQAVIAPVDFLGQVVQVMQSIGGLPLMLKVSALIMLIIASMKVSFLNGLIWSKLGSAQVWVAPLLGLIAGILGLGAGGAPLSLPLVFAYVSAGGGAMYLHEILDFVKKIPGLGSLYVTVINLIEKSLGGKAAPSQPEA